MGRVGLRSASLHLPHTLSVKCHMSKVAVLYSIFISILLTGQVFAGVEDCGSLPVSSKDQATCLAIFYSQYSPKSIQSKPTGVSHEVKFGYWAVDFRATSGNHIDRFLIDEASGKLLKRIGVKAQ